MAIFRWIVTMVMMTLFMSAANGEVIAPSEASEPPQHQANDDAKSLRKDETPQAQQKMSLEEYQRKMWQRNISIMGEQGREIIAFLREKRGLPYSAAPGHVCVALPPGKEINPFWCWNSYRAGMPRGASCQCNDETRGNGIFPGPLVEGIIF